MVISMTLAEIFLMLVFVVWYGFTPEASENARLVDTVATLRRNLALTEAKLAKAQATVDQQRALLDWWRTRHPREAEFEGKSAGELGGSGFPKCDRNGNVIAEASVLAGAVSVGILQRPAALAQWFETSGRRYPDVGTTLTDAGEVRGFLATVGAYYADNACRWDYRLLHQTARDYMDGRKMFEGVFYSAGIREVLPR
jgi:hypothetical protein